MWTYSRDENLLDAGFLTQLIRAMLNYDGGKPFELDNFDLLLTVQAVSHLERSQLGSDNIFMRDAYQLGATAETFVVKNFDRLNVHEFTTIVLFYLRGGKDGEHDSAVSK